MSPYLHRPATKLLHTSSSFSRGGASARGLRTRGFFFRAIFSPPPSAVASAAGVSRGARGARAIFFLKPFSSNRGSATPCVKRQRSPNLQTPSCLKLKHSPAGGGIIGSPSECSNLHSSPLRQRPVLRKARHTSVMIFLLGDTTRSSGMDFGEDFHVIDEKDRIQGRNQSS